jgi:erythronate-4-phosphate dehydrogenase
MKILADASLPNLGQYFPSPFQFNTYDSLEALYRQLPDHNILLCRSTLQVNEALLGNSPIQYVATASSGTCHIDEPYLKGQGIQLFDAKGCNAKAVADYVIATLAWLMMHRGIRDKQAGIIGMGYVGNQVAKRLHQAGFAVKYYDPYRALSRYRQVDSIRALTDCDVICIHANLHHQSPHPSQNLLNTAFLSLLRPNTTIINAARGGIVNEADLLTLNHPLHYCTDVYINEPDINPEIVDYATLCTPHIAGHTVEAKDNAVRLISQKLHTVFRLKPLSYSLRTSYDDDFYEAESWQDMVLKLYNPFGETCTLKNHSNKKQAFIRLRQAHIFRHDFSGAALSVLIGLDN